MRTDARSEGQKRRSRDQSHAQRSEHGEDPPFARSEHGGKLAVGMENKASAESRFRLCVQMGVLCGPVSYPQALSISFLISFF